MKQRTATFQCLKCLHMWQQNRPSGRTYSTDEAGRMNHPCRVCGHLYSKWINYEQEFVK